MNKKILIIAGVFILLATLVYGFTINGDLLVQGSIETDEVTFTNDAVNHKIYDNSTCVIIEGDTVQMAVC